MFREICVNFSKQTPKFLNASFTRASKLKCDSYLLVSGHINHGPTWTYSTSLDIHLAAGLLHISSIDIDYDMIGTLIPVGSER